MSISKFIESLDVSQEEFAAFTGIPRPRIAAWIRLGKEVPPKVEDANIYENVVNYLSKIPKQKRAAFVKGHRYILGNFEPVEQYNETIASGVVSEPETPYNETKGALVPYYDVDIMAGAQMLYDDKPAATPSYYLDIPEFAGCKAFPVFSDSMAPLITPGSTIFLREVHNWRDVLEYGQIYTVQLTDFRRVIKYIRKSSNKDNFTARSHNPAYDDFELPKKMIDHISLVEGWMLKKTQ